MSLWSDLVDNCGLDLCRGHPGHGASAGSVLQNRLAHIIAVKAIALTGVGRREGCAVLPVEQSLEQGGCLRAGVVGAYARAFLQDAVNPIPGLLVDETLMFASVPGALVHRFADVGAVVQHPVQEVLAHGVATRDGLFSATSGNPVVPAWLAERLFGAFSTKQAENDKYRDQIRSSAGIAVLVGSGNGPEHWVRVGRSFQRFALQATALGIGSAHINQSIKVPALCAYFADWLGVPGERFCRKSVFRL